MEVFEVHITGDQSIIEIARQASIKAIIVDLLKPDLDFLRSEYMTSQIFRFENYTVCKENVDKLASALKDADVDIKRVKIESPYYRHYVDSSLYMESHFSYIPNQGGFPISKSKHKDTFMMTDRTYAKENFESFREKHSTHEIELCLYDSDPLEDADWFELYEWSR